MADAESVNIGETPEQLVHVQLDLKHWHCLLDLGVVTGGTVDGLWDVLEDKVEIDLILLKDFCFCLETNRVGWVRKEMVCFQDIRSLRSVSTCRFEYECGYGTFSPLE